MQKINEELCRATNNKLLVNAHSFMHAASNLVAVFWYQIDSGKLVYSLDKDANHPRDLRLEDKSEVEDHGENTYKPR